MNLPDWQAPLHRREALKLAATGIAATSLTGWLPALAARAAEANSSARAKRIVRLRDGLLDGDIVTLNGQPAKVAGSLRDSLPLAN